MEFRSGQNIVASQSIPKSGPKVELTWNPGSPSGRQKISWKAIHSEGVKMQHHLCVVLAKEQEWRGLTLPFDATEMEIDFENLPGGKIAIGVVSTDGFNITKTLSDFFELPLKPCVARIDSPVAHFKYLKDQPIRLSGIGYYPETMQPEKNFLHWETVSGEALGCGASIEVVLPAGKHEIRLVAGTNGRAGEHVREIVVGNPWSSQKN
jgi:hypothetical protein